MAGKFLTVDEAAETLGVSVEEVQRLVDRKKLYPIRDGAALKFRSDEIERHKTSGGESSIGGDLDLDLGEPIEMAESIFASDINAEPETPGSRSQPSETLVRGDAAVPPAEGSALSMPSLGEGQRDDEEGKTGPGGSPSVLAGDGLELDSILGISGADLDLPDDAPEPKVPPTEDATVSLDLDDVGIKPPALSDKEGLSISGASGLSLEGDGLEISGLQLSEVGDDATAVATGIGGGAGDDDLVLSEVEMSGVELSGVELTDDIGDDAGSESIDLGPIGDGGDLDDEAKTMLGDDFDLGTVGSEDESASQVIDIASESGDSSFLGATMAGGDSSFNDESDLGRSSDFRDFETVAASPEMGFSALQISGLVCCALLMLLGGFIAYDLVRAIGSSDSFANPVVSPILDALSQTFGWR